ncbi:MAG: hypothetical protein ACR2O1_17480 [Boseongicola sp.]
MSDTQYSTVEQAARYLTTGEFDALSDLFQYPFAFYYEDEFKVIPDKAGMMEAMKHYRRELHESGVVRVDAKVIECDMTMPNCHRCKVHWLYYNRDNTIAAASEHELFLRLSAIDSEYKIELMDVRASSNQAFRKFMGMNNAEPKN